jgi:Fur family transcriptional regulator, ferric uptake regulator
MGSERSERDTQQRRAIRSAIDQSGRPMSPREVLESALPLSPGLGIATVYRTLKSGVDGGWLTQVELPGEPPRYESTGKLHHHHFHCRRCDRVYEIEGCPDGLRGLTPPGFSLEAHEVVLYGLCAECAR